MLCSLELGGRGCACPRLVPRIVFTAERCPFLPLALVLGPVSQLPRPFPSSLCLPEGGAAVQALDFREVHPWVRTGPDEQDPCREEPWDTVWPQLWGGEQAGGSGASCCHVSLVNPKEQ